MDHHALEASANLAQTWLLALEEAVETPTEGLARMNAALGTAYGLSRLGEWTRGERAPDARAFAWMLADALPAILRAMPVPPRRRAFWTRALTSALALPENRLLARRRQAPPSPQPGPDRPGGST